MVKIRIDFVEHISPLFVKFHRNKKYNPNRLYIMKKFYIFFNIEYLLFWQKNSTKIRINKITREIRVFILTKVDLITLDCILCQTKVFMSKPPLNIKHRMFSKL